MASKADPTKTYANTTTFYAPATVALRSRHTLPDPFRMSPDTRYPYPQQQYIPLRLVNGKNTPRSLLAYHGVGVGKTRVGLHTIKAHIEHLREYELFDFNTDIEKRADKSLRAAIIFVPGQVLQSQWKHELKNFASELGMTSGTVLNNISVLTFAVSKTQKEKTDRVGMVVINDTLKKEAFVAELHKTLKAKHANTLFIVDESHTGLVYGLDKQNKKKKEGSGLHLSEYLIKTGKATKEDSSRLLLLTATPTYDNLDCLKRILNLLYGFDDEPLPDYLEGFPTNLNSDNTDPILGALEEASIKYVSFVRGENPQTFPVRLAPNSSLYPSSYKLNAKQANTEIVTIPLGHNQLQYFLTNPVTVSTGKWRARMTHVEPPDGANWMEDLTSNAPVLDYIMKCILKTLSGIVVVSFKYNESLKAFTTLMDNRGFKKRNNTKITENEKQYRYRQYISREGGSNLSTNLLKFAASPENSDGRHVKVIVIMPAAATGTDLKNVRQFHVAEPEWSEEALDQVIGRGFRSNSHLDLPPKERNVVVHIYQPFADDTMWNNIQDGAAETMKEFKTGERAFEIMLRKKSKASKIIEILQRNAFDNVLQNNRTIEDYDNAVIRAYPLVVDTFNSIRKPVSSASLRQEKHPTPPTIPPREVYEPDRPILFNNKDSSMTLGSISAAVDVMVGVFRLYVELSVEQLVQFTRFLALTAVDARHAAVGYYPVTVMYKAIKVLCNEVPYNEVVYQSHARVFEANDKVMLKKSGTTSTYSGPFVVQKNRTKTTNLILLNPVTGELKKDVNIADVIKLVNFTEVVTPSGSVATVRRHSTSNTVQSTDTLSCVDSFNNYLRRQSTSELLRSDWIQILNTGIDRKREYIVKEFHNNVSNWINGIRKKANNMKIETAKNAIIECIVDRTSYIDLLVICSWAMNINNNQENDDVVYTMMRTYFVDLLNRDCLKVCISENRERSVEFKWDSRSKRPYEYKMSVVHMLEQSNQKSFMFIDKNSILTYRYVGIVEKSKEPKEIIQQFRNKKARNTLIKDTDVAKLRNELVENSANSFANSEHYWFETAVRMGKIKSLRFIRPFEHRVIKASQR